jgi:formylglycine-generating enzyme required for sulfatase activity
MGKPKELPTYGWDCEYGTVEIDVNTFYASKYLVSNGEYLEFVSAGAYENKNYWTNEGW